MSISDTAALCQEQANSTARSELAPYGALLKEAEVLRQRNAELEAELVKLNKTIGGLSSENFDREVAKLREELGNRIEKQELKNTELENRLVKVEQSSPTVDAQTQNVTEIQAEASAVDTSDSVIDAPPGFSASTNAYTKATEDEEEIRKPVSQGYTSDNSENLKEIESKAAYQDKSVEMRDIVIEFVQGLAEELLSRRHRLRR